MLHFSVFSLCLKSACETLLHEFEIIAKDQGDGVKNFEEVDIIKGLPDIVLVLSDFFCIIWCDVIEWQEGIPQVARRGIGHGRLHLKVNFFTRYGAITAARVKIC